MGRLLTHLSEVLSNSWQQWSHPSVTSLGVISSINHLNGNVTKVTEIPLELESPECQFPTDWGWGWSEDWGTEVRAQSPAALRTVHWDLRVRDWLPTSSRSLISLASEYNRLPGAIQQCTTHPNLNSNFLKLKLERWDVCLLNLCVWQINSLSVTWEFLFNQIRICKDRKKGFYKGLAESIENCKYINGKYLLLAVFVARTAVT